MFPAPEAAQTSLCTADQRGMAQLRSVPTPLLRRLVLVPALVLAAILAAYLATEPSHPGLSVVLVVAIGLLTVLTWSALVAAERRLDVARAELAEERQLLRAFLETTPDHVYFKDLESRFIRVSHAQAAKLGLAEPADAVGRTDFEFFASAHASRAYADEQSIVETGKALVNVEQRETYPDGREGWASTTKLPLRDARGAIIGTLGISHDITVRRRAEEALRESEERWRTLMDNSQEMVMLVDRDGLFVYASPSVQRWLGHEPGELIGGELEAVSHADDVTALSGALEEVVPAKPRSLAHRVRHRDGSWHSLQSTLVCLRDDPTVQAVLIAARDVTERVALEQDRERLELERRVSHRLEAVGQLAAGIAHEINTPLQFVGDSVSFLGDAVDELLRLTGLYQQFLYTDGPVTWDERRQEMRRAETDADLEYLRERVPAAFGRTIEGISRVRSIVQAMKRFSHPSSSEAAPADLGDAIETTLAVCRNEYKYVAEVALELGRLPPVMCNIGELNQVFLNLIINAAQAIEEKVGATGERGHIRISTRVEQAEAVVEIADDGPGIPIRLQDRIYEPFFTTKEVGTGSGQGLALARTIIERHGGSIECASRPPHGTTFTLRLPLAGGPPQR
jgi:two-component system NtrC family sensor kinase